jgi:hypothetical protein
LDFRVVLVALKALSTKEVLTLAGAVTGPSPAAHLTMRVDLSPRKERGEVKKRLA